MKWLDAGALPNFPIPHGEKRPQGKQPKRVDVAVAQRSPGLLRPVSGGHPE